MKRYLSAYALMLFAGCATQPAWHSGEVVVIRAADAPVAPYPAAGTVWRLNEQDLKTLSPAPIAEPPPPPRLPPPPRPNEYRSSSPPAVHYYYGPAPYWYDRRW